MKNKKLFWTNKEYILDSTEIIANYINIFWNEVMSKLDVKHHILLLIRVKYTNGSYSTIGDLQKLNNTEASKNMLIKYLKNIINLSFEVYKDIPISSIIFSFGIRDGIINQDSNIYNDKITSKYYTYYNNKLPIAIIPEQYGKILTKLDNIYFISCSNNTTIILEQNKDKTINTIKYIKDDKILFTWTDEVIDGNRFVRKIGKSILYYENGDLYLYTVVKKTKAINKKRLPKIVKQNRKVITMDLETILVNNIHVPYLLSWFDGKIAKSYFNSSSLDDNIFQMVKKVIKDLNI